MSDVEPPEKKWLKKVVELEEDRIKLDFFQKQYRDNLFFNPTMDEDVRKVLDDNAQKLQQDQDKVHHINFTYCKHITDVSLNLIGETFGHILKLDLASCPSITEKGISKVLSRNITELNFGYCKKVNGDAALQSVIDHCPFIETLIAYSVGITTVPTNVGTLQKLNVLNLRFNNITVVPSSILDLPKECELDFKGNPLQEPPKSVIEDGRDAMMAYYEDLKKGARISNKLKFVLLGTGEAGKTTIANILNGKIANYMPAKDERTIHLDLMTIPIHKDGHDSITLTVYDCGGQSKYAVGQVQFITSVGFYVLVVDAGNEDSSNITRFLVILQARAPGAVIQIVLSKTDLLNASSEIESKKKWIHKYVRKFQNNNSKNDNLHKSKPLDIQPDIIDISAKNTPENSRDAIINRIFELSDASPPILPSVRQSVPKRWLAFERFLMAISAYGLKDTAKLCEAIQGGVEQKNDATDNAAYSDETKDDNNEPHGSNGYLEWRNFLLPFQLVSIVATSLMVVTRPTAMRTKMAATSLVVVMATWNVAMYRSHFVEHDVVEEKQTKQEEPKQIGNPYVSKILTIKAFNLLSFLLSSFRDDIDKVVAKMNLHGAKNIEELIATIEEDEEYSYWLSTSNSIPLKNVFNLLQAQGVLFQYDGLLYIDPNFISTATKPFVDHTLDVNWLKRMKRKEPKDLLLEFIDDPLSIYPPASYDLKELRTSMEKFLKSGYLDMKSVNFLLRDVPLKYQDYEPFLKMLIDAGIIFNSSFDPSSNDNNDEDSQDTDILKGHAVVLYRLKDTCNAEGLEKVWKPKPFHIELRIFFPSGCPPSLAANFAASIHSLGRCRYAYIHGAVVCTKPDNNYIRADLMKDEDGEDYLSCAIRSSRDLGREGYCILARMLSIVEKEKKTRLPGLMYDPKIVCPQCLSTDGRPLSECSQLSWSIGDKDEFCDAREEYVSVPGFGTFMIEDEGMNASNIPKNDGIASDLLKPLVRRHVLMSARFLGDITEKRAREIYNELRVLGVNVFMVEAGLGEKFGDATNFGLYYMIAMIAICSDNYGQKTKSPYSSHAEVNFAVQNWIPIVPVKFGETYPPEPPPDFDGGNKGREQNKIVFSNDLVYRDWSTREWDAKECAKEIKKALEKLNKCPMIDAAS